MLVAYLIICGICTFVLLVIAIKERNLRPQKTPDSREASTVSNDPDPMAAEAELAINPVAVDEPEHCVAQEAERLPAASRY